MRFGLLLCSSIWVATIAGCNGGTLTPDEDLDTGCVNNCGADASTAASTDMTANRPVDMAKGGTTDMVTPILGNVPACSDPNATVGVPTSGRPSYDERVAFYASDRARADPAAIGWPSYPAVPPLLWRDELAQSSRAHSQDMHDTPCFQHPSCNGTGTFVRIQQYWTAPFSMIAENILAGVGDGQTAIHNWIEEINAPAGETGHRDNTFSRDLNYVGLGYVAGGKPFQGYWTQDFVGVTPPPALPRLVAGAHFPVAGAGVTWGTVYYDAAGAAPTSVLVVIDGKGYPLNLVRGRSAAGAYEGKVGLGGGCHRYQFRAVVGSSVSCYPGRGTLGVSLAGACADYTP